MCITRPASNAELTERAKSDSGAANTRMDHAGVYSKQLQQSPAVHRNQLDAFVSNLSAKTCVAVGLGLSAFLTLFSLYFPFWLSPDLASKTYILAFFQYHDPTLHHFDTTAWTYGTDYGLAVVMLYHSVRLYQQSTDNTWALCQRIWGLTVGYAVSVTAGGMAHQFYTHQEVRNAWHFRLLWTICVGSVTFASQPMGCIAAELAHLVQPHTHATMPRVPDLLWRTTAITTTACCVLGWFSYQRPACDIFIAGITQFPTSFYIMGVLWQIKTDKTNLAAVCNPRYLWMGILAFIANAPLLPMYPLLVHHTNWSLAQVNTFLHTYLLITWSMQAISLRQVQKAIVALQRQPPKAVPLVVATNNDNKKEQ